MTQNAPSWHGSRVQNGLARCAIILIAVTLGFTVACLPLTFWIGNGAPEALLAAVGVCITPGLGALAITHHFSLTGRPLVGMLLGMGCRLLPPLVVCMWLAFNREAIQGRLFAGFLIAAYLVTLAVETYLSVRSIDSQRPFPFKD